MNAAVAYAYLGHSRLKGDKQGRVLQFAPNLTRDPVAFDARLLKPVRFREAVSALHDVVITDLKYKPKDKTAYQEWRRNENERIAAFRKSEYQRLKKEAEARTGDFLTPELEKEYKKCLNRYRKARRDYDRYLRKHDPELWRIIIPYDPVITVGDDTVFFECFSSDESAYGCLSVNRQDGFGASGGAKNGTTNVDYSWDLYNQFQRLRTYRETRFTIDPEGFAVKTENRDDFREEKIELPSGWLRGFMQLQSAMTLPMRRVTLSVSAVYSLLAWLKRHRARKSPRAIRFELTEGAAPRMILEPWEQPVISHGTIWDGPTVEPLRIWGRDRLMVLARLLPLVEKVEVHLLGTGLPSFWVAHMGEMRFTLGLSGWTANDWTKGSSLDLLAPPVKLPESRIAGMTHHLRSKGRADFPSICSYMMLSKGETLAILNHLAHTGQVIYDLGEGVYRWRQIMPFAVGKEQMGPPNPELTASHVLVTDGQVNIKSVEDAAGGAFIKGTAEGKPAELLLDMDGRIRRGQCVCGHYKKYALKNGPCRHMLSLREVVSFGKGREKKSLDGWFNGLRLV